MKKIFTYYSLGLLTAFGLIATGVQAFDISNISIVRENYENRARYEITCDRVGDRLDLSYICDGRPKPPTPAPASCGNGIVESGEECDGSAPEGYICSNRCELINEDDLTKGEVVINEVHFDVDSRHGVEPSNEWIELYNTGTTTVDLYGWLITDSEDITLRINKQITMEPGEFALLSSEVSTESPGNVVGKSKTLLS